VTRPGIGLPGAARPHEAEELASRAEAAGCDAVWVLDTRREPYLSAAASLRATRTIPVGTNVAVAFARSPAVTAAAAWDLAQWGGGGRFILGLGSQVGGTLEARFGISADHPAPRMRDYIAAVRACWEAYRQGHGRYKGEFYSIRWPVFQPGAEPEITPPPIYVAAVNPVMVKVAGECADGLAAHPFTTPEYIREVIRPALAWGAAKAGRPTPPLLLQLVVAPDRESAVKQMTAYCVPAYRRVLDHAGLGEVFDAVWEAGRAGRRSEARRLIDAQVLDRLGVIVGDDLAGGLKRWSGIADRLSLSVPWYGTEHPVQMESARRLLDLIERGS
jgi:probable F420-dependent oxidoreductase